MDFDRDAIRAQLEKLRADLERDETASEKERETPELDQTSVGRLSRMDAIQVQAMAMAAQRRRRAELDRVIAALVRLDMDDFGSCAVCGQDIGKARLLHNPSVASCIECARQRYANPGRT